MLAGILAFLCRQNRFPIPPRPSRYLPFQLCARALHHRRPLGGRGHPQPTRCMYLQAIRPSQVLSDMIYAQWWEICPTTAELLGRRMRFFHGLGSSTRSSTLIARVHYSCTSVYLITWTVYLCILRTCHYDVMVGCWFTGQGKKGDCVGKKVNGGPVRSLAEMALTHSEFCVLFRNVVPSGNHSVAKWWGTRHGHTWVFYKGGEHKD